jgi:hypothetical protein
VTSCYEHGNETSDPVMYEEFIDYLRTCSLPNKGLFFHDLLIFFVV